MMMRIIMMMIIIRIMRIRIQEKVGTYFDDVRVIQFLQYDYFSL